MANNYENVSLTDTVNESQISVTESQIMSEGIHSTPVTIKKAEDNELMKMMQMLFNVKFDKFDEKFNAQSLSLIHILMNFLG